MMHGYKPVEIEIQLKGARRRLRVQVDEEHLKNPVEVNNLLYKLFTRLRDDMNKEGIF